MSDLNPRLTHGVSDALNLDWSAQSLADVPIPEPGKYTAKQLEEMIQKGIGFHQKGKTREAMELYREVLLHDRGNKKALYFSAIALSQENQPEEQVLAIMKHAVTQAQHVPEAHYNLGILLHRMGKEEEARDRFLKAIKLMPKLTEAKVSLAGCYLNLGDKETGRAMLKAAADTLSQAPDSVYSRAFAKLTLGMLFEGWVDYDFRWRTASFLVENRRDFANAHFWNGKPIPGKNLYVHTEQGAGDVIMLSRFLEEVARRSQAKTVTFEVGDTLTKYLAQCKGVDFVIASNSPIPEEAAPIHYYLPMMSIPRQCRLFSYDQLPHRDGWLAPLPETPKLELPKDHIKVGIAWAGSKAHKNDRYRSILWPQFRDQLIAPFAGRGEDVKFYSFQVGERARDMDDCPEELKPLLVDLTPGLKDFNDTANAAQAMDLMVLVDTATLHVAASLKHGPPVWAFIPAAPDWRWLLTGWETKWYDRVTLFRQDRCDDWQSVLQLVQKNVESFVDELTDEG